MEKNTELIFRNVSNLSINKQRQFILGSLKILIKEATHLWKSCILQFSSGPVTSHSFICGPRTVVLLKHHAKAKHAVGVFHIATLFGRVCPKVETGSTDCVGHVAVRINVVNRRNFKFSLVLVQMIQEYTLGHLARW